MFNQIYVPETSSGSTEIIKSQAEPSNPVEGMLWWELDSNDDPIEEWPWKRFGSYWASRDVIHVQKLGRNINGNPTLAIDDKAPWPERFGLFVSRVNWSFLRSYTNSNESVWRAQLFVRLSNNSNAVVDDNFDISNLSPSTPTKIEKFPNFGYINGTRLIAINVFRTSGTGEIDFMMSAEFRAWRI